MKLHVGPFADHWRRRTLAAFGVTVDEQPPEPQLADGAREEYAPPA